MTAGRLTSTPWPSCSRYDPAMGNGGLPGNAIYEPRKFTVDERFTAHFRNLKQVFMYINDDCNLSCEQCIYKPHVKYHDGREIQLVDALGLLSSFREMGAFKVTFLGGEPTLYGRRDRGRPLGKLIDGARNIGYSHVRLDTNGQFAPAMFDVGGLARLDEIAFSIDGYDAQSNDLLRGEGSFAVATTRLRLAVRRGIRTSITCCIHDGLVRPGLDGTTGVEKVIAFAQAAGAEVINFHDLFKAGVPMDTWTGSFDTTVEDHLRMYDRVRRRIENHEFSIEV